MTTEQFEKYSNLNIRLDQVKSELTFINAKQTSDTNKKINEDGWLELTYGNGSRHGCVLSKKENVIKICSLIETLLQSEIADLEYKMRLI